MFIIIVFDRVLTRSSPLSSQDFYCSLPRDQSRDVTPRLGVNINYKCTSFRVLASSFRLLLLRLCSNRCAEALVVYRNPLLSRLTGKLLLSKEVKQLKIIIIILYLMGFQDALLLFLRRISTVLWTGVVLVYSPRTKRRVTNVNVATREVLVC